jgi:chorismate synthase
MENLIRQVKADGDTIGGVITCNIQGCPVGVGEPEFGKLHQQLASAMMSINAAHGFDYGAGFGGLHQKGSEQNDIMTPEGFTTNNSGGIQGGISNGEDIYFRVAFKPIATQLREQNTVDVDKNPTTLKVKGRHDPCVLPRAVPIVEAMAAITILDCYLLSKTTRI